ncbi:hypothetical protein C8F01DRAFT_1376952 [Mycena amicta]|nr:hypothetical protein C8F01DRAFT_1377214 [Mycena amicta]KAJ7051412.1 hypothetical protein C8F01DRAFT_1376952 [Mycena amicta]
MPPPSTAVVARHVRPKIANICDHPGWYPMVHSSAHRLVAAVRALNRNEEVTEDDARQALIGGIRAVRMLSEATNRFDTVEIYSSGLATFCFFISELVRIANDPCADYIPADYLYYPSFVRTATMLPYEPRLQLVLPIDTYNHLQPIRSLALNAAKTLRQQLHDNPGVHEVDGLSDIDDEFDYEAWDDAAEIEASEAEEGDDKPESDAELPRLRSSTVASSSAKTVAPTNKVVATNKAPEPKSATRGKAPSPSKTKPARIVSKSVPPMSVVESGEDEDEESEYPAKKKAKKASVSPSTKRKRDEPAKASTAPTTKGKGKAARRLFLGVPMEDLERAATEGVQQIASQWKSRDPNKYMTRVRVVPDEMAEMSLSLSVNNSSPLQRTPVHSAVPHMRQARHIDRTRWFEASPKTSLDELTKITRDPTEVVETPCMTCVALQRQCIPNETSEACQGCRSKKLPGCDHALSIGELRDAYAQLAPAFEKYGDTQQLLFDELRQAHDQNELALAMYKNTSAMYQIRVLRVVEFLHTVVKSDGPGALEARFADVPEEGSALSVVDAWLAGLGIGGYKKEEEMEVEEEAEDEGVSEEKDELAEDKVLKTRSTKTAGAS